jgi:type IV pilus assembly protein PilE
MRKHGAIGFTLIELMIVVVVIALLTTVAYPSYRDYVIKGKRAEAKAALLRAAQMQERYYSDKATYLADLAPLFGLGAGATVYSSENPSNPGKDNVAGTGSAAYTIAAAAPTAGCPINACFSLTATPRAPHADAVCGNFTLTSTGTRGAAGGSDSTSEKCRW